MKVSRFAGSEAFLPSPEMAELARCPYAIHSPTLEPTPLRRATQIRAPLRPWYPRFELSHFASRLRTPVDSLEILQREG